MTNTTSPALRGSVVDEEAALTVHELSRASQTSEEHIELWVMEGVLQPRGSSREEWRFSSASLTRTRVAARLTRDLEINSPGVALALELLDEIAALEAQLRRGSAPRPRP